METKGAKETKPPRSLKVGVMPKEYHTDSEEYLPKHREVYHDHEDCPDGKHILAKHRKEGTGGKPRCKECIKLG